MRVTGSTKPSEAAITPRIVGVCGGSGSGKTFFASALQKRMGSDRCDIVCQDSFYFDQSKNFDFDGGSVNFDHPDSIDFDRLSQCLLELKAGRPAQVPIYDFVTHSRKTETVRVAPKPLILVDGILIFHATQVRELFDDLFFFDTPESLRFERRLFRDVHERGRTEEGVRNQFFKQVKPMHDTYVEPSKVFAKVTVRDESECEAWLQRCVENFS
jgi:uridine kinase